MASPAAYNKSLADLNRKFVVLTGLERQHQGDLRRR